MIRRVAVWLLCLVLLVLCLMPAAAPAEEDGTGVVRVGWYESSFNKTDAFGRRFG